MSLKRPRRNRIIGQNQKAGRDPKARPDWPRCGLLVRLP
jgi:hypothetical protein